MVDTELLRERYRYALPLDLREAVRDIADLIDALQQDRPEPRWECGKCHRTNYAAATNCTNCGEDRPEPAYWTCDCGERLRLRVCSCGKTRPEPCFFCKQETLRVKDDSGAWRCDFCHKRVPAPGKEWPEPAKGGERWECDGCDHPACILHVEPVKDRWPPTTCTWGTGKANWHRIAAPSEQEAPAEHVGCSFSGLLDAAEYACETLEDDALRDTTDCSLAAEQLRNQIAAYRPAPPEQEAPVGPHNAYTCDCGVCNACNGRDLRQEPGGEEWIGPIERRDAEIDALKQEVERLEDEADAQCNRRCDTLRELSLERQNREQAVARALGLEQDCDAAHGEKATAEYQRDGWMERHKLVTKQKEQAQAERDQFATESVELKTRIERLVQGIGALQKENEDE